MTDSQDKVEKVPDKSGGQSQKSNRDLLQFYTDLRGTLMRFAVRYFKKPHEIEDVVQEAFVKVMEAQTQREVKHLQSYMFQTVKNLSLNKLGSSYHRLTDNAGDLFDDAFLVESRTLEDQFESRQKFELFCRAVRQLPVKCQRVYILRRVYGLSQKETAEKLGISVKTVEAHLTKAIVRCTDYMAEQEAMELNPMSHGRYKS